MRPYFYVYTSSQSLLCIAGVDETSAKEQSEMAEKDRQGDNKEREIQPPCEALYFMCILLHNHCCVNTLAGVDEPSVDGDETSEDETSQSKKGEKDKKRTRQSGKGKALKNPGM